MNTKDIIIDAMKQRRSIKAIYEQKVRLLSPYKLGTKGNKINCLFYQYGGESSSGPIKPGDPNNWRCMDINKLSDVEILEDPIHLPKILPYSGRSSKCIDDILFEIN